MHRERKARVDDRPNRAEHALLVVPERLRRAGDEDDPATVAIDVALEERDVVIVRCLLDRSRKHVDRLRGGHRAFRRDDLVGSGVADERDRSMAVLAFERPYLEQLGAQGCGDRQLDRNSVDIRQRLERAGHVGSGLQEPPRPFLLAKRGRFELGRGLRTDEDFAGLGGGFHLHGPCRSGPGDEQLAVRFADEEELEEAAVNAGVHP